MNNKLNKSDKAVVGAFTALGCLYLLVMLAFWAAVIWGIVEVISWLVTK